MELSLLLIAYVAGILTVLAPCILPVLPIILGGSVHKDEKKSKKRAYVVIGSLVVSIAVFTILLKLSSNALGIDQLLLERIAGVLLIGFGLVMLLPQTWEYVSEKLRLNTRTNATMSKFVGKEGFAPNILLGASLGPVFSSCSPAYATIVALTIRGEVTFAAGVIYIALYALGLGTILLLIARGGNAVVRRLEWATDPNGWFKRALAVVFILLGILILTGLLKDLESWLLSLGLYDPIAEFENNLLE